MLHSWLLLAAVLIVIQPSAPAPAQTTHSSGHELTLDELIAATHIYFRDTAEFPMIQNMVMTVTNSSGHVRKRRQGTYDYLVEGYPSGKHEMQVGTYFPRDADIFSDTVQAWNGALWSATASNIHAIFPVNLLWAKQEGATLVVLNRASDGVTTARLVPSQACPPFAFSDPKLFAPKAICGKSEVQLRPDLSLQRFVFDEAGLPAPVKFPPFGKTTLQSFRVDIEFQEVVIEPDPKPYVVPARVTSTLVTNKGTFNIVSEYTAKRPGTLKKKFSLEAKGSSAE